MSATEREVLDYLDRQKPQTRPSERDVLDYLGAAPPEHAGISDFPTNLPTSVGTTLGRISHGGQPPAETAIPEGLPTLAEGAGRVTHEPPAPMGMGEAAAAMFTKGMLPGAFKGRELIQQQVEQRLPPETLKRFALPVPTAPATPPHVLTGPEALQAAELAGNVPREMAIMEAAGPVLGPVASRVGGPLAEAAAKRIAPELATGIGRVLSRAGTSEELAGSLGARAAGAIPAAAAGAPAGVAYGAMREPLAGRKPTAGALAGYGALGAALAGIYGAAHPPVERISFGKGITSPEHAIETGQDPWQVLGLNRGGATETDVRAAWKNRRVRIERTGGPDAERLTQRLNVARDQALSELAGPAAPIPQPPAPENAAESPVRAAAPEAAPEAAPTPERPAAAQQPAPTPEIRPAEAERITAAAVKAPDGQIFTGAAHPDAMIAAQQAYGGNLPEGFDLGFATSTGRYVGKDEATQIAKAAGQAPETLPRGRSKIVAQDLPEAKQAAAVPPAPQFRETPGATPETAKPGDYVAMPLSQLHLDPKRFQYKISPAPIRSDVWDETASAVAPLAVWRDPADGKVYVVNGHRRYGLAEKLGRETVPTYFIRAQNPGQARMIGALINIREDHGTPLDAAKLFREAKIGPDEIRATGIDLSNRIASEGLALSKLNQALFQQVASGSLKESRGVVIGKAGLSSAHQDALFKLLNQSRYRNISNEKLMELIRFAKGSGTHKETETSLFGEETIERSNLLEKADLSTYIKGRIKFDKGLFSGLSKAARAQRIETMGVGQVDVERAKAISEEAAQLEEIYDALSTKSGPISTALNEGAARMVKGEAKDVVERHVLKQVKAELQRLSRGSRGAAGAQEAPGPGLVRPTEPGGAEGAGGTGPEPPRPEPARRVEPPAPAKPTAPGATPLSELVSNHPATLTVFRGVGRESRESVYKGPIKEPILGPGKYYTDDRSFASQFGPTVEEATLNVKLPLVIRTDEQWRHINKLAGNRFPNPAGQENPGIRKWLDNLQSYLKGTGFDAVVVEIGDRWGGKAKTLDKMFGGNTVFIPEGKAAEAPPMEPELSPATQEDLFGESKPPAEKQAEKQADLFSSGPNLSWEEARAREIVARLRRAVTAGKATRAQKERYREALALLRRGQGQSAEEVALRSSGKGLPQAPGQQALLDPRREDASRPLTDVADRSLSERLETPPGQVPIGGGLEGFLERPDPPLPGKPVNAPQVMDAIANITQVGYDVMERKRPRVPVRQGKGANVPRRARGAFFPYQETIHILRANNISTAAHEVGHAIEKILYGWPKGGPWKMPRVSKEVQAELMALGKALYRGKQRPDGGYKREGWAQWTRKYITETGIEKEAPRTTEWVNKEFFPAHPELEEAFNEARDLATRWREQGSFERLRQSIVDPGTQLRRFKKFAGQVGRLFGMEEMVDMAAPFDKIARAAEKQLGRELQPSEDPFFTTSALRTTHHARVRYAIEHGMIDIAGNVVGPPLMDVAPLVKGRDVEFEVYLFARRARAMLNDPKGARDPGISLQDATFMIEQLDSPDFDLAAGKLYAWNDAWLDYASASKTGKEVAKAVRARDPGEYVPLQREFEEMANVWRRTGGGSSKAKAGRFVQKLKGSGRRTKSPVQSSIAHATQIARATHERIVIEQLLKLSRVEGLGYLMEEIPRDQVPVKSTTVGQLMEEIDRALARYGAESRIEGAEDLGPEEAADMYGQMVTFFAPRVIPSAGSGPVTVIFENGKMHWYRVDPELFNALSSLDVYRLPDILGIPVLEWVLGKPTEIFRAGTTGLRASFGLVWNMLRDPQTMLVNSRANANSGRMMMYWLRSMANAALYRSGTKLVDPALDAFLRLGGEMSLPLGQDIPPTRRAAHRVLGRPVVTLNAKSWPGALGQVFDAYRDFIQFPELAPRTAEVMAIAKDIGYDFKRPMTLDESLKMLLGGKQVSTDFTAAGALARVLNRMLPFFNAQIQGPRANIRAFKRNPRKFVLRGLMLTALTVGLWWKYKDEEWYNALAYREKFLYWHFPLGEEDNAPLVRIPRAFEVGTVFSALPEALLDAAYRENPDEMREWMKTFLAVLSPNLLPNTLDELHAQWQNKDTFWGTPIETESEKMRPRPQRYNEYTSKVAIALGRIFGASPKRIDHAITGTLGPFAGDVIDVVGLGGRGRKREKGLGDVPVFGRMFRRGGKFGSRPRQVQDIYDHLEKAQQRQHGLVGETAGQREARLQLTDAVNAVSALLYVRAYTPDSDRRAKLTKLTLRIAESALEAEKEGTLYRATFQTARRAAEALEKEMKQYRQATSR